jgi:hypothetical protein
MRKTHDRLPPLHLVDTDETINGRAIWQLAEPFEYQVGFEGHGALSVCVPAGFRTDLASVPRLFWYLFPPDGPYRKPAVIHDYLYSLAAGCPRFLADAILRDAMDRIGVRPRDQLLIYYAVRLCGGPAYHAR